MPIEHVGFIREVDAQATMNKVIPIEAAAGLTSDNYLVNDDAQREVQDVLSRESWLFTRWAGMAKNARSDSVSIPKKTALPSPAAVNKRALENTPESNATRTTGESEEIKCVSVAVTAPLYSRMLAMSQGFPYGDQFEEDNQDALKQVARFIDQKLIDGDVADDVLEFNGISKQLNSTLVTKDFSGSGAYDATKLTFTRWFLGQIRSLVNSSTYSIRPSIVVMNQALIQVIENEFTSVSSTNYPTQRERVEIIPGVKVPGLYTASPVNGGLIPLLPNPWCALNLNVDATIDYDDTTFFILDEEQIGLYYIPAAPGAGVMPVVYDNVDPTDLSQIRRRQIIAFNTPYCKNRTVAHRKVKVIFPAGTMQ